MRIIGALAIVTTRLGSDRVGYAQTPLSRADVAPFEGVWVLDVARSGLTDVAAERRVITSGPTSMRIEIHRAEDAYPISLIYKFDGSTTESPFGAGTAVSQLSREGTGLLLQTVFTINNQPITVHELLPSHPYGAELAVAVMLRVEHGYQGVAPASGRTTPNVSKTSKFFHRQP